MGEALEGRRRDEERHRQLGPEDGSGGRDHVHVHEDPRAQLPARIGGRVGAQRLLVAGAARVVRVRAGVEPLAGRRLEVVDVDELHQAEALKPITKRLRA